MDNQQQMQQPIVKTSPYQSPMHSNDSNLIQVTSSEDELIKMELTFRNQMMDEQGNIKKMGDALMNDAGINSVIGQVQALVNKHSIMGNFDTDIPNLITFLNDSIVRDLMMNRDTYDVTNSAARDKIHMIALSTAYIVMKRGYKEGDKRFWKGSTQEIKTVVEAPTQRGKLARALGWR